MYGNHIQNAIIIAIHNTELIRNGKGVINLKKNNPADNNAKTFTNININFISLLLMK
jgi:hypothetical protein